MDHISVIVVVLALVHLTPSQNINYFGVAFSPYVRNDGALWNSYDINQIKQMLKIVLNRHNSISTYGMGVGPYNTGKPWDQGDSNCLVARAAAQINKERKSVVLSVSIGINQNTDAGLQAREIQNAFSAAQDANSIFGGTVWGLTFTNEYVTDNSNGPKVLQMIKDNKEKAGQLKLKVGTRIHTCGEIHGGPNQAVIKQIVKSSDFIMCNLYPAKNSHNPDAAVKAISDAYYSARDGFLKENPKIEVIIGETGWASEGETFFNPENLNTVDLQTRFWNAMKVWANGNKVKVQMFEAFDESWKTGLSGEKKFGWWKRADGKNPSYIEKSTGKKYE